MLALIILFCGMRERVRHFGGELQIQSDSGRTIVMGILPLQAAEDSDVNRGLAS
jgi:signal transduction histidine kinase